MTSEQNKIHFTNFLRKHQHNLPTQIHKQQNITSSSTSSNTSSSGTSSGTKPLGCGNRPKPLGYSSRPKLLGCAKDKSAPAPASAPVLTTPVLATRTPTPSAAPAAPSGMSHNALREYHVIIKARDSTKPTVTGQLTGDISFYEPIIDADGDRKSGIMFGVRVYNRLKQNYFITTYDMDDLTQVMSSDDTIYRDSATDQPLTLLEIIGSETERQTYAGVLKKMSDYFDMMTNQYPDNPRGKYSIRAIRAARKTRTTPTSTAAIGCPRTRY